MTKTWTATIYKLTWGGKEPEQSRFFHPTHAADAAVRFSERVLELDRDPAVSGAYVCLERLPDRIYPEGMHLMAWTKTSNERPTVEGELTAEDAELGPGRTVPVHRSGGGNKVEPHPGDGYLGPGRPVPHHGSGP